jgi:DNA polymerase-4
VLTLGQLSQLPQANLCQIFGAWASEVREGARGQGSADLGRDRPMFSEHDPDGEVMGSISNERTFRADVHDPIPVERVLSALSERVCFRARKRGVHARTITLKLRYADFHTLTRSRTVAPTCAEREVFEVAKQLLVVARSRSLPIRLLGIALSKLGRRDVQLTLFDTPERLGRSIDRVRQRFGYDAVHLASSHAPARLRRQKRAKQA